MRNIRTNVSSFDEVRRALAAVKSQLARDVVIVNTTNTPYAASGGEHLEINSTSGAITVNLPLVTTENRGRDILMKVAAHSSTITIAAASGNTIDGGSTQTLAAVKDVLLVESDGVSQWRIIHGPGAP